MRDGLVCACEFVALRSQGLEQNDAVRGVRDGQHCPVGRPSQAMPGAGQGNLAGGFRVLGHPEVNPVRGKDAEHAKNGMPLEGADREDWQVPIVLDSVPDVPEPELGAGGDGQLGVIGGAIARPLEKVDGVGVRAGDLANRGDAIRRPDLHLAVVVSRGDGGEFGMPVEGAQVRDEIGGGNAAQPGIYRGHGAGRGGNGQGRAARGPEQVGEGVIECRAREGFEPGWRRNYE